jgi:hypothetical protein
VTAAVESALAATIGKPPSPSLRFCFRPFGRTVLARTWLAASACFRGEGIVARRQGSGISPMQSQLLRGSRRKGSPGQRRPL